MSPARALRITALASAASLACAAVACSATQDFGPSFDGPALISGRPSAAPPPDRATRVTINLLYTTDEHGWALPFADRGVAHGGAAELLAHLVDNEGHCARADCTEGRSLLVSGGDNFTGPAISTYFRGESMATAMRSLGYFASAVGNHEYDFGRAQFGANRATSGITYLSANAEARDGSDPLLRVPATVIAVRSGVRIGILGLTTETMPFTADPRNFQGLDFVSLEAGFEKGMAALPDEAVDVRIALVHECPPKIAPVLERHPEWKLAFVGGGHCHKPMRIDVGETPVVSPGWRFARYARTRLDVDLGRPAGQRLVEGHTEIVTFSRLDSTQPKRDAALARALDGYGRLLDAALGETVGYVGRELKRGSPELHAWITRAIREEMKVDVALTNLGCFRQAIAPGPVTKKTIYSLLPFDNTLVVARLRGADLVRHLSHEDAIFAGARSKRGGGFELSSGAPIQSARLYSVATTDFVYEGGDRFTLKASDPKARYTGIDWRTPVLDWTRRQKCSAQKPLENVLAGLR